MILDSTFLHDLVRGDDDAVAKLEELIETERPVALSALTVFEVGVGLRGSAATYREQFDTVIDDLEVVPLGREEADYALEIQQVLYDRGEPIGAVNVLIAGTTAIRNDATVLTRNVDEFSPVDGIDVETY